MIVQCDQCNAKFRLDDSMIKDGGAKVREDLEALKAWSMEHGAWSGESEATGDWRLG